MEFFKLLAEHAEGVNMTLRIMQKNGKITLGIMPDHKVNVDPLTITGTPEELDTQFFEYVKKPLQIISGIVTNAASVTKQAEKAATPATPEAKKAEPKEVTADDKKEVISEVSKLKESAATVEQAQSSDTSEAEDKKDKKKSAEVKLNKASANKGAGTNSTADLKENVVPAETVAEITAPDKPKVEKLSLF